MSDDPQPLGGEVFRYSRGDEVRIYSLRVVKGGAELWKVTMRPGQPDVEIKEDHFSDAEACAQCFEEIDRMMQAGKWRKVDR